MQRYSFLIEGNIYLQEGFWSDIREKTKEAVQKGKHTANKIKNSIVKGYKDSKAAMEDPKITSKSDRAIEKHALRATGALVGSSYGKGAKRLVNAAIGATAGEGLRHANRAIVGATIRNLTAAKLKKERRERDKKDSK